MKVLNFLLSVARTPGIVFSALDRALEKLADALGAATLALGSLARLIHTGRIQQHVAFALIGIVGAMAWLILS